MARTTTFDREAILKYATVYLKTLLKNPNFLNPSKGGTTANRINEMFMTGLQPPDFVVDIKRYGTETVKDTNTAIRTELPLFMVMVNKVSYKPAATATEKTSLKRLRNGLERRLVSTNASTATKQDMAMWIVRSSPKVFAAKPRPIPIGTATVLIAKLCLISVTPTPTLRGSLVRKRWQQLLKHQHQLTQKSRIQKLL